MVFPGVQTVAKDIRESSYNDPAMLPDFVLNVKFTTLPEK